VGGACSLSAALRKVIHPYGVGSPIGQRARKRHQNNQSDNCDHNHHDDNFWIAEALTSDHQTAAIRCAVPSAKTRLVSLPGPPSSHPIAKPRAINKRPARIPRVPKTSRTLSMFAALINNTSRI
jgi:hypothetical protein